MSNTFLIWNCGVNPFYTTVSFYTPGNIRKPLVFWFFRRYRKRSVAYGLKNFKIIWNDSVQKKTLYKKTIWSVLLDGVQGWRATTRRQFTFYLCKFSETPWYSFDRRQKDEGLSRPWSRPVVLNTGPLDWESSA